MRHKILSITAAMGMALSTGAMAADSFNFEVGGQYIDFDVTEAWAVDTTVFFQPVSAARGPLAEAGFLNRASNLSLAYLRQKNGDFDSASIFAEFYADDWYFSANYNRFSNGFTLDDFGLQVGLMVDENTRATIGYNRSEVLFGSDLDIYSVGLKHVTMLNGDTALNLEGEVGWATNGSDDIAYNLQADYYLNRNFSFGARYRGIGSDDEWGLGTRYFFTPNFSGGLEYTRVDSSDVIAARIAARF